MRKPNDAYMTPAYYVEQLIEQFHPTGPIFEPCVGDGAISKFFPGVCITNDIDPKREADHHFDASIHWPKEIGTGDWYNWVITNPPFNKAFEVLQQSMYHAPNIALLLRISFMEPTKQREHFLVNNPPSDIIYLPRYSFTQDGKSDSSTCMWAIWQSYHIKQSIRVAPRFPR